VRFMRPRRIAIDAVILTAGYPWLDRLGQRDLCARAGRNRMLAIVPGLNPKWFRHRSNRCWF
jgi:hypothetical protein